MGFAFRPVRGNWEYKLLDTASAATFGKGCPVTFNTARTLQEMTTGSPAILGIAMHRSVDSFPSGKVLVAIPQDNSAVATCDVQTGVVVSALSIYQSYTIEKSGNTLRLDTDSQASAFLQIVGPTLNGTLDSAQISATSRVEVVILRGILAIPSASSGLVPAP